jgi:hypothetical protein
MLYDCSGLPPPHAVAKPHNRAIGALDAGNVHSLDTGSPVSSFDIRPMDDGLYRIHGEFSRFNSRLGIKQVVDSD